LKDEEIYAQRKNSVFLIGKLKKTKDTTGAISFDFTGTAFAISSDGVCVTNYHVLQDIIQRNDSTTGMDSVYFIETVDRKVYFVEKILAYSQNNDLAIFKVNTRGGKLRPLSPGKPAEVGAAVYCISHPQGNFYYFSKGIVARNVVISNQLAAEGMYRPAGKLPIRMEITADYGGGSSGGPILDKYGNLIGIVCSTRAVGKDTKNEEGKDVHVMHACGHDAHMAAFIGTARALAKLKDQWHGTILFVAQPAEETGNGARALLKDGLYEKFGKPNFALGFHDKADLETGRIGVTEGYTYANVDSVDITVRGVGGHGAYPYKTKDPIVLAAEIINTLQTIASRQNNPLDPIVITVGSIHGGTKHNIIPNEVKMQVTVRTYKPDVRERVLADIDRIAKGCAAAAGVPPQLAPIVNVSKDLFCPATYNNPELTKRLVAIWRNSLGNENVEIVAPTMGGEDFSEYSLPDHSIPAVDFHIGAVEPAKIAEYKQAGKELPTLHSSQFAPVPEPTIRVGIIGMTSAVLDLMK